MKRIVIVIQTALLVILGAPASLQAQAGSSPAVKTSRAKPSDSEKIKQKVQAFGIGHRVTVVLRNGNEYYGALGVSGADSFELSEIDLNQTITVAYSDVKTVRSGFGNPNQFNGKRWRPGWHIASIFIALGVTVALIAAAAHGTR